MAISAEQPCNSTLSPRPPSPPPPLRILLVLLIFHGIIKNFQDHLQSHHHRAGMLDKPWQFSFRGCTRRVYIAAHHNKSCVEECEHCKILDKHISPTLMNFKESLVIAAILCRETGCDPSVIVASCVGEDRDQW